MLILLIKLALKSLLLNKYLENLKHRINQINCFRRNGKINIKFKENY